MPIEYEVPAYVPATILAAPHDRILSYHNLEDQLHLY
jgi:hypothetical protein